MAFDWTINPYRGCEFGCVYCYARYTHQFMELRRPEEFEAKIFAKQWDRRGFREELSKAPRGEAIAIGTATDPYQPAEKRYRLTRAILEVFLEERGRRLSIATKSDLVARDAGLLAAIGRHNHVSVGMTITTLDAELARLLEPRAPRPDLRLAAIDRLSRAGVRAGVLCCPILPLLTDSEESLDALASASARAGARFLGAQVVFLRSPALEVFLGFLDRSFPSLADRYRLRFRDGAHVRGEYPRRLAERVARVRARHGLNGRDGLDPAETVVPPAEEMSLWAR